jgi:F0F1-type ATP synthase membrane subunit c/vacuolar-type H+-ATPase subunit K
MGTRPCAALAVAALLGTGCFGYNRPAKRWAYVGNSVLIAAGGGAIAQDVLGSSGPEPAMAVPSYEPPLSGMMLAGIVLATAGVVGIVFNASRPIVKTSR